MLLKCCLLHRDMILPRDTTYCIFVFTSTSRSINDMIFLYDFQYHCNHIISLKQPHLYTWAFLFSLRVLLSFCLIVCQFQPCVAYKSVAYKKECILTCLMEVTCFSGLQIEIHQIFWSISSYRYNCIDSRIQKPLWKCLSRCKRMFQKEK